MTRLVLILMLGVSAAMAQDSMTPNGPFVIIRGTPTIGNCMEWVNANTITDSGVAC